jgi:hypothetical protein
MNIKLEIEKLQKEKSDLEAVIVVHKDRIKWINAKCRQLETVRKHAESILTESVAQEVKDHEESEV